MNEKAEEGQPPGRDPLDEDVGEGAEKKSSEAESTPAATPGPPDSPSTKEDPSPDLEETLAEVKEEAKSISGEPPVDWFEPLEDDDDAESIGRNDPEEESLAGESERSESVGGSESTVRKKYHLQMPRRKRSHPDEGWVKWPALGEGWKRKEVVRRSGSSVGQKDVYYLSPRGERVRSRVELISMLDGSLDLSKFEYKSGTFYDGEAQPIRIRHRMKRKMRERSSSESSWMERGEGADTPDSYHRLTPNLGTKNVHQTGLSSNTPAGTPNQGHRSDGPPVEERMVKLPLPSSSKPLPLPSINGEIGSEDSILICARCGISFTGTWYDKQRKRPCCPACWESKTKEHPMIRFRKWIPCGQCVGCHDTMNCGQCANCKRGLQNPDSRKRTCRKRKCVCPIRKAPGSGTFMQQRPFIDNPDTFDDSMSFQSEFADSQHPSLKSSDTENFSVNVDVEDEDELSTDDDDDLVSEACRDRGAESQTVKEARDRTQQSLDAGGCRASGRVRRWQMKTSRTTRKERWHKKRKRRSCGECKACLCRKDCGTCDFCVDKPKFGGSNKKRQKCRLRQCQRQAMVRFILQFLIFAASVAIILVSNVPLLYFGQRHLLPFQMGQSEFGPEGPGLPGRPRPTYTYSRKTGFKRSKGSQMGLDSDNEDDDSYLPPLNWSSELPMESKPAFDMTVRNHHSSMQLNHLDFGERNGLSDRVPHIGNSHLDEQSRWDVERSHAARVDPKHVDEDDEEEDELPMITQIFSLADSSSASGADVENQLMKLLDSLRSSVLPILWYAIMVDGPQLQLIQCSKQSSMTDTIVLIDPGFCYQVTVQKQPLLPTHPLYDHHPPRLTSVTDVVNLLLGLEKYTVCQGLPPTMVPSFHHNPIILERASTCDFLVNKNTGICADCRALQGL
ncbi:methyl-CpG-binding domain protein 1b isoform X2 [Mugil cephalus]|uniref:methyl-CpG-binding domain protein 1b isoform X2 n=1 Tax=Mugil cephalus TaxID=48193 RepID=UPI001FB5CEDF|nr:methyl-CpG-binding domain protein 1b isoform X2 [Mugil cephalus]